MVIKNPDNVKKRLMPSIPAASLSFKDFGPNGSIWAARTARILMPRHPSRTGNLGIDALKFLPVRTEGFIGPEQLRT